MLNSQQVAAIPSELRLLPQWVGAENKIPVMPGLKQAASVTDPATWGTFEKALEGLAKGTYSHIGFVFTDTDPYVFVDLDAPKENGVLLPATDERFQKQDAKNLSWVKAFNSYTERSQSGFGYHIIIRAKLAQAVKLPGTEIYFSKRYAIFTGDAIVPEPIFERQKELDQIVTAMRLTRHQPTVYPSKPQVMEDKIILAKLAAAVNSGPIQLLWEGNWKGIYPSQSEADHALLSHLCFYAQNDEQVARLFRQSLLGQRPKANGRDPYVETSIGKIRQSAPQPIDFSKLNLNPPPPPSIRLEVGDYPKPPGVLGEIADYIYGSAIHPVHAISYAGALGFGAGIVGRHFNISGTGLNLYILLLAATGLGKEGAADGIDNLYSAIRPTIPEVENFRGPSNFASGIGLIRSLGDKEIPSVCSIVGEFGIRLAALSDPRANGAELGLKAALLEFFSKSGEGKTISPTVYSDSTKNTALLYSPALTVLGVSTPETFFAKLSNSSVEEGLIPRFMTIAYTGAPKVSNKRRVKEVPQGLIDKLSTTIAAVIYMGRNNSYCDVQMSDAAVKRMDEFEVKIVNQMTGSHQGAILSILNRAHLKALRLGAIAAVFDNSNNPKVTNEQAIWAIKFVEIDIACMLQKFETGDVGEGDSKQLSVLREKLGELFSPSKPPTKNESWLTMLRAGAVPHSLISQKLMSVSCFANDRRGATAALKAGLKEMIDGGELREIPPQQVLEKFQTTGKVYVLITG